MITVRFGDCSCAVNGHAGAGDYGQDLVCAAVSALTLTLASAARALKRQRLREIYVEPGQASIRCLPGLGGRRDAETVFFAAGVGFSRLAQLYPEFIRVSGIEKAEKDGV